MQSKFPLEMLRPLFENNPIIVGRDDLKHCYFFHEGKMYFVNGKKVFVK